MDLRQQGEEARELTGGLWEVAEFAHVSVGHLPQVVAEFRLLLVDFHQVQLEDFGGKCALDVVDAVPGEVALRASAVCDHVDVRVVPLVMEGGVPLQILLRDLHRLRDGSGFGTAESAPALGVVVAEALRVRTAEGKYERPHISRVLRNSLRHLRQIDRLVRLGEETVVADLLHAGALRDVLQVNVRLADVQQVLRSAGDELGGICHGGCFGVVLILVGVRKFRDLLEHFPNGFLLILTRRKMVLLLMVWLLHALSCGVVFHQIGQSGCALFRVRGEVADV